MSFYARYPSSTAPVGGATAANQVLEIALLTSIDNHTPTLGQKTMANSSPVVIASDQSAISVLGPLTDAQLRATPVPVSGTLAVTQSTSPWIVNGSGFTQPVSGTFFQATQPISAAALPLPSGASTSANQATEIASLASIDSKLTSPLAVTGPLTDTQLRATPVPISGTVTASNPSVSTTGAAVPASATFVGGSDGTNLRALKVSATGVLSVDGSASTQPISGTVTVNPLTNSSVVKAQLQDNAGTAIVLGQTTMSASVPVVIASNQTAVPVSGTVTTVLPSFKEKYTLNFSTSPLTTSTYVTLAASTTNAITAFEIYNTTEEPIIIATGAAASEVDKFYIFPGGNAPNVVYLSVNASTRLSLKSLNNPVSGGYILVNLSA